MTVRKFKNSDIKQIYKLLISELGKEISLTDFETNVLNMSANDDYQIFVAEKNREAVGFIGVHFGFAFEVSGKIMRIIALAVSADEQNHGIGTCLIECAEKYALEKGAELIGVNSGLMRKAAHTFYTNRGFTKKGYSFVKNLNCVL